MGNLVSRLDDHYIVCGAGNNGAHIVEELHATHRPMVVIEIDEERVLHLREQYPDVAILHGDATDDETLQAAGIARARGLVSNVREDSQNLLIVVQARFNHPKIMIVARVEDPGLNAKIERAGADFVVNSSRIGGLRLASQMIRPNTVTFLDRMMRGQDPSVRVDEIVVEKGSFLEGKKLNQSEIFERTGLRAIALQPPEDDHYHYNPSGDELLDAGAIVIVIGNPEQIVELDKLGSA